MSEKSKQPLRVLFCVIIISAFLFLLSSVFLLESANSSSLRRSVFRLLLVSNTSMYIRPNSNIKIHRLPNLPSIPSPIDNRRHKLRIQYEACQGSSSDKKKGTQGPIMGKVCDPDQALLRIFMYDLPLEFHFGLLGWKGEGGQIWPNVNNPSQIPLYPGGLNLQHSIEYWLTLDLLSSNAQGVVRPCTAVRVKNSSQADIVFVPFFSSLSYSRHSKLNGSEKVSVNEMLQDKLVEFLTNQDEWKRLGGKDHLIVAHHPKSMSDARKKLGSAMFMLADFDRYLPEIANIEKDMIAPYRHVVRTVGGDSASFEERPILAYFQGAIYRKDGGMIHQELYYLLKDEKDVHFAFGSVRGDGISRAGQGMASSKFCLNIAGDTPSSNRLFDAIASHCVPVIISDEIELPFEDVLDYSEFCIFVHVADAIKNGFLVNLLRGINHDEWTKMWQRLKDIVHHFEYQYPSQPGDAVDMIWEAISHKVSSVRFKLRRMNRYNRAQL